MNSANLGAVFVGLLDPLLGDLFVDLLVRGLSCRLDTFAGMIQRGSGALTRPVDAGGGSLAGAVEIFESRVRGRTGGLLSPLAASGRAP